VSLYCIAAVEPSGHRPGACSAADGRPVWVAVHRL